MPLTQHRRHGARVEGVHQTYNLSGMLPLNSPSEAGASRVQDFEEGAVDGECKGALEKSASAGSCHHNRSELL